MVEIGRWLTGRVFCFAHIVSIPFRCGCAPRSRSCTNCDTEGLCPTYRGRVARCPLPVCWDVSAMSGHLLDWLLRRSALALPRWCLAALPNNYLCFGNFFQLLKLSIQFYGFLNMYNICVFSSLLSFLPPVCPIPPFRFLMFHSFVQDET